MAFKFFWSLLRAYNNLASSEYVLRVGVADMKPLLETESSFSLSGLFFKARELSSP